GVTSVDNFLSSEAGDFPRQFVFIEDFDAYFKAIGDLNGVPNWQVPVLTPRASSVTKEEVYGAYIQANIRTEIGDMPFSGNIGVRIARTSTSASGFSQSIQDVVRATANPAATALITTFNTEAAVTIDNSYWNVLPSLNFVLEMRDDLFLRFAAAQTITRPTISDLSVAESFQTSNIETFSVTSGNPLLTPYKVNQVDIGLEYYGESGDTLSATFFYKGINTFISEATVLEDSGFTLPFTGSLEQARTSQQNRDGGRVLGLELAATHYLDYISALEGFGIQANYTYANASDDNAPQVVLPLVTAASLAVEGFAKHTFNLIGFYDKGPLQLRLAYNWRDTFLLSRQGARSFGLPEHSSSFGQLDFSASYNITDNLVATVEGINITNQRLLRFEDIRERVSLIQYTGRRIRVGVRASF
ncbi:N-acetylglucosamine-regulated TonB-dependent outer membrane receptor, partial [hydrothermal vent metagenome]